MKGKYTITRRFWARVEDPESTPEELREVSREACSFGFEGSYAEALELQISSHLARGEGVKASRKKRVLGFLLRDRRETSCG